MTDRIKEAREALEAVELAPKASRNREVCQILFYVQHKDTILKALSAYEKLQGVDFKTMKRVERNPVEQGGKTNDWYQNGYDVGYNQAIDDVKARLVADIGKDG